MVVVAVVVVVSGCSATSVVRWHSSCDSLAVVPGRVRVAVAELSFTSEPLNGESAYRRRTA